MRTGWRSSLSCSWHDAAGHAHTAAQKPCAPAPKPGAQPAPKPPRESGVCRLSRRSQPRRHSTRISWSRAGRPIGSGRRAAARRTSASTTCGSPSTSTAVPQKFVVQCHRRQPVRAVRERHARSLTGPARGDLDHWRFETADIAGALTAGANVHRGRRLELCRRRADGAGHARDRLAAPGRHGGRGRRQHATRRGRPPRTTQRVARCPSIAPSIFHEYFVGGPGEQVDARRVSLGLADSRVRRPRLGRQWTRSRSAGRGASATHAVPLVPGPRTIPPMEEAPERFARVARADGAASQPTLPAGLGAWTIPAAHDGHACCWIAAT